MESMFQSHRLFFPDYVEAVIKPLLSPVKRVAFLLYVHTT